MGKKVLSILVAVLMIMSMVAVAGISASAATPSFKGGTIYWECPWPTDGRGFKAYCHIWGSDGSELYAWQDPKEEMTPATDKGDNIFKYDVPAGPYDEVIFSVSTGVQTFDCVLTDDCIGKTATTDKSNMIENPVDSNKTTAATEFEGVASSGPHLAITSLGNVVGKVKCPTEDGASVVAAFIKNYLVVNPDNVTSDILSSLVKSFDTSAQDVYNVLAADSEFPTFTLDDGTKQLDKAAELLGVSGGSTGGDNNNGGSTGGDNNNGGDNNGDANNGGDNNGDANNGGSTGGSTTGGSNSSTGGSRGSSTTSTTSSGTTTTGDTTPYVVLGIVLVAALGIAIVAAKKKVSE